MPDLLKILLVDDNPDDRLLIIRELRKLFLVDVDEVFDNKGFERACKQADFDIVITDYQLRWTTGIEILIRIKTSFPFKPVIMFTGTGSEEIAVMAMKIGLDDYILKTPQHYIRLALSVKSIIKRMQDELLRKQAESALHKSEEDYRVLIEKLGIGISRYDKDLNILLSNEAHARMFGTVSSLMTGLKHTDLYLFPDSLDIDPGSDFTFPQDFQFERFAKGIRIDKSVFDVHLRIFPTINDDGELTGFVEIAEDVTLRLKNERIQETMNNISTQGFIAETLAKLVDSICFELGFLVEIPSIRFHIFNELSRNMVVYCYPQQEACDESYHQTASLVAMAMEKADVLFLSHDDLLELSSSETLIKPSAAMTAWLGVPLRNHSGIFGLMEFVTNVNSASITGEDVDILRYVANHISLVLDYKRNFESLIESEIRYRSLVEQSTDGVAIIDEQGTVLEWNDALAEIVEFPASKAIGRKYWEIYAELKVPESATDESLEKFRAQFFEMVNVLNKEKPFIGEEILSFNNGTEKKFQVSFFFINYRDNVNIGAFVRDITNLKIH